MKIIVQNLSFWYREGEPIFDNLHLELPLPGWIAISGESGVGKTTLAKLLAGILEPCRGSIIYPANFNGYKHLPIGFLYQNPDNQLVQLSVERELAFILENAGLPVEAMHARVEQALDEWGLRARRQASPQTLSGGEKQRLALASLLIDAPHLLIFDEPTSGLDILRRLDFYQYINELHQQGIGIIWVTQDENELNMAEQVLLLGQNGEVVWQ